MTPSKNQGAKRRIEIVSVGQSASEVIAFARILTVGLQRPLKQAARSG